tara:strand:+ start:2765 stop:3769 length:1005 start_codon:yes stop_codon:yes gene_type:complete
MDGYRKEYQNKIGVLLTNLGTPKSPTRKDVKKYLNQFLSDKRVVDINRLLWIPILKLIILTIRPSRSAKLYQKIWTKEGSPLLVFMHRIKNKIIKILEKQNTDYVVEVGMRYGEPSIENALTKMKESKVSKIIVFPLYPQAGSPTTSTTLDEISHVFSKWPWVPELRFINGYHDNNGYINALSKSIENASKKEGVPEKILFSYHGMPKRYLNNGDPYYCFCHKTTRLVAEKLNLNENQYDMSFQSRFGTEEWLKPYTDKILIDYARQNLKNVHIISPGFSVDCLETLEEIKIQYLELFHKNGGKKLYYIPCLNESDDHIKLIKTIIMDNISGWK